MKSQRFSHSRWLGLLVPILAVALIPAGAEPVPAADQVRAPAAASSAVPRGECFPLERLPEPLRREGETLLLKLMDSEALYTVVGGLKPVSSAFASYQFKTADPELSRLDDARRILDTFRCGDEYFADLLVFSREYSGTRHAHAFIAHRPTLAGAVRQYAGFFAPYGVSPATHPVQVAYAVEYAPKLDRNRGYGYLYGYPRYAVDFFVESETKQETEKGLVPRDFINIPVHSMEKGRFVWAVPKGHRETEEDRRIRDRAAKILAEYRRRRERYVGEGKPGIVALLRDWLDDGTGRCSSAHAFRTLAPLEASKADGK